MVDNVNKITILAIVIIGIIFLNLIMINFLSFDREVTDNKLIEKNEINGKKELIPSETSCIIDSLIGNLKYKVYVEELPYSVDGKYEDVIKETFEFWEELENVEFKRTYLKSDADIFVSWVKDFGGEKIGYAYLSLVEISLGDSYCGVWIPYTYDYVLEISKHEFGHRLGYDHSDDSNSFMYHTLIQEYEYNYDENNILPAGYVQYYPFCTSQDIQEYSIEINSNELISVYVVPSYEDYEKILDGDEESALVYQDCVESNVMSYNKKCVVEFGSGIVLYNLLPYKTATYSIFVK